MKYGMPMTRTASSMYVSQLVSKAVAKSIRCAVVEDHEPHVPQARPHVHLRGEAADMLHEPLDPRAQLLLLARLDGPEGGSARRPPRRRCPCPTSSWSEPFVVATCVAIVVVSSCSRCSCVPPATAAGASVPRGDRSPRQGGGSAGGPRWARRGSSPHPVSAPDHRLSRCQSGAGCAPSELPDCGSRLGTVNLSG